MKGTGIATVKVANKVAPKMLFKAVVYSGNREGKINIITDKIFHRREILVKYKCWVRVYCMVGL